MPPDRPLSPPEEAPTRLPWRGLKITLITLVVVLLGGVVLLLVWAAGRYQQGVELARKAREEYSALNNRYPFQTPKPNQPAGGGARWAEMLRSRGQIQREAPPRLRQLLDGVLAARSLTSPALYRQLIAGLPLLDQALAAQLEALRREQMSAREYQWLLGLAITAAMEQPERYPAGDGYWKVLRKLERLTHADGDADNDVNAQEAFEFFQKNYAGAARPGAESMVGLAGVGSNDEAACALDLLMVAAQWAHEDAKGPEGALKGLLQK